MKCEHYYKLISLYIDDMLNPTDKAKLESHLEECHSCRKELRILQIVTKQLQNKPDSELPKDFHNDLMDKIHCINKKELKKNKLNKLWISMAVIAASFLIVIVSKNISPFSKHNPQPINETEQITSHARIMPHDQNITFEIQTNNYDQLKDELLSLIEGTGLKKDTLQETTVAPENIKHLMLEVNVPKENADKFHDSIFEIFKQTNSKIQNEDDIVWKFKNPEETLIFNIQEIK